MTTLRCVIVTEVCGARVEYGIAGAPPAHPLVDLPAAPGRPRMVADRRRALIGLAGVGQFLIEGGERVVVEPDPGGDPHAVPTTLYGTVAALVLAQRGEFALHASTVTVGRHGVALAGTSRAGKSTTALALRARGHRLVADDVSPVPAGPAAPSVVPFGRPLHVWPETAAALDLDVSGAGLVSGELTKLALPAPPPAPLAGGGQARPAVPLHAVVLLRVEPAAGTVTVAQLPWVDTVAALHHNAYRAGLLASLWPAELFGWAVELTCRVPVWLVTRPAGEWSLASVVDRVEAIAAAAGSPAAMAGSAAATPYRGASRA